MRLRLQFMFRDEWRLERLNNAIDPDSAQTKRVELENPASQEEVRADLKET